MKHRFPIPFLDGETDAFMEWVHRRGWHVDEYRWSNRGIRRFGSPDPQWLTVTLTPWLGAFPDSSVSITASSGATLVYDDVEQSMGITLLAEPQDAVPPQPEDARPR